jgi:hypothetical protein
MNRLSILCGSTLLMGLTGMPAIARIKPEPTMCFIRFSGGEFRDLSQFCGASRYLVSRVVPLPAAAPADRQKTDRQSLSRSNAGRQGASSNAAPSNITTFYNAPPTSGSASSNTPVTNPPKAATPTK